VYILSRGLGTVYSKVCSLVPVCSGSLVPPCTKFVKPKPVEVQVGGLVREEEVPSTHI
jgi:hypothetical protein